MRRIDDKQYDPPGMTAENVGAQFPYSPEAVGSAGGALNRQTTISLSVSLSEDTVPTAEILQEEFNQQDSAAGNRLTVGNKFAMGQGARSFESALGATSARPEASETARMCFGNAAHSFESTLPHYRSFEQSLESHSMYFDPLIPQKIDIPASSSESVSGDARKVLEIPIHNERRRHSFGPSGIEGLGREPESEATRHNSAFSVRQSPTGEDGRRVLRKQVAIDVVEDPFRLDVNKARYPPFLQIGSKELEKEEKRVISHYNIDAYSFAKQTAQEKHVTVIRNPPNQGVPSVLSNRYQGMKETSYSPVCPLSDSELSIKPTINVISNRTSAISSKYRSHYLEPKETLRGLSSGSEESPGTSSREPSPFRKEPVRAVSPYSKELKYSSPTPVIKTQVKKEVSDIGYELQTQSSSGSEGTFPEITNIVITTDTGESLRCKTEDSDSFESSDHSHRRHLHPGNFKKHLHARYLSSLRNRASSSSTDTSQEHLSQEMSDSLNRSSDVFESSEAENMLVKQMLKPILVTHEGSSETSDDNDIQMSSVIKSPPHSEFETSHVPEATSLLRETTHISERYEQVPLDLSHGYPPSETFLTSQSDDMSQGIHHGHGQHMGLSSGAFSEPDLLSPSLSKQTSSFHRSPHLHSPFVQSPLSSHSSQSSPLCSVPEGGRIFQFNFPSPFEGSHAHSDPEFGTPSPMSPGLHFTFPPRASMLSSMSELNRLAVSPRAYYPNQPLQLSPLTKTTPQSTFRDVGSHSERRTFSDSDAYLCPVCGQVFPSYDNLAKHMAKHLPTETIRSGDNNKIHYCKVCNRSFSRSDMLTRHMRLHTGLKPYECDACGQVFSRSDHLNTHRRTHTGEKPYRCPQCSYAACRRDMITRHMRTHTKRNAKRGKFLSVPEREASEIRKSSVSSTDTTSSQEMSSRTFSASSGDSLDLESNTSASVSASKSGQSLMSMDSGEMDVIPSKPRNWSSASTESYVFEEQSKLTHTSSMESKFISSTLFRQTRNWSTTSFESVESEDTVSRHDSVAEDTIFENEPINNNNSPLPIEHESFEKCSISSEKNTSDA